MRRPCIAWFVIDRFSSSFSKGMRPIGRIPFFISVQKKGTHDNFDQPTYLIDIEARLNLDPRYMNIR